MDRREHPGQSSDQNFSECERSYLAGRGFKRYNNSLKNLIPIRREGKDNGTLPVDSAGLLSVISFSWLSKFMYQAHSKGLTLKELPNVSPYDSCIYNVKRLELLWKDELAKRGPEKASCLRVVWRFSRTRVVADSIVAALSIGFGFLGTTVFMRKLLESIQSGEGTYGEGIKWALLLSAAELMRTLFFTWTCAMSYRTALRVRSACMTLVYRKIIRVNNLGNKSIGEVINIFSNDAQKIFDMVFNLPSLVAGPILTVFVIFYILWLFSPMALLGMTAFILYYPVQYAVTRLSEFLQSKAVKISDTRIRLMNEILNCIKLIKMYAWEKRFSQQILETREEEQQVLLKTLYCQGLNASMAPTIPIISVIITFLAHVYGGNNLTAAQGILLLEDSDNSTLKPILKSQAVVISDGTFAGNTFGDQKEQNSQTNEKERNKERVYSGVQNGKEAPLTAVDHGQYIDVLFDISFEAGKGKLVGICGHVGSGKTSLLLAALGQLQVSKGQVMRDGSCAYVSQEAWITNATLRENILFGSQFDHDRYYEVIYSCNLSQDISMMPGGDQTEIGEKGVNLSGGQKQRVALARALYADRDIYFLDDPLSAVDARVGSHIFDNLINGALAQKTVLFVSHQIQYLNRCDDIYMMRAGRIIEHGTHEELMKLGNEYALMVEVLSSDSKTAKSATEDSSQNVEVCPPSADANPLNQKTISHDTCGSRHDLAKPSTSSGAPLTVADSIEKGTIKAHTYHSYIVAAGGYCFSFTIMLTFLVTVGSTTFSSWWLALWIKAGGGNTTIVRNNETTVSDNINDNPDFWYYQSIYGASIGVIILTSLLRTLIFTKATIRASTELHKTLFVKIIECPMRFFETTPSGRLQHLFSRDMDEVDNRLPVTLTNVIQYIFILSFAMLAICLVIPWFILPLCVLTAVYYFISKIFRAAIRDLRRLENKSRAPMLGLVATTVQGLSTIHAFGKETDFTTKFMNMFDENSKCLYLCNVGIRWLAVRLDCLSVLVTGITAFFVISLPDQVPPALAGLALSYSAHISGVFQFAIRMVSETEVRLISVERINYYLRTLKSEGGTDAPSVETPLSWPEVAKIKFNNVNMAYGESSPYSLKNISFTIDAGEKIGIVGRTGSGKSSLTVALFRLFELTQGHIEIDDIDISKISLDQLRRKLSIIPQDPVLFSGTIRSNLDPFHLHNDAEIWQALENTKLSDRVRSITGQLDASVGFGGDNLSVGEKQLLCLSRALLRNSKVLVLDEATAAVDPETEIAVQNTIQQAFVSCTVLTIAHRLKTVLSLDRVLVMDDGKLIEFDTPTNLLKDRNSEFYKMMAAAEKVLNQ